jgi:pimeloyl-ACP methyl ester carboxylesterase
MRPIRLDGNPPLMLAALDLPGTGREATPKVYVHGLGSSSFADYPAVVAQPPLAGVHSLLVDLPGFGFSDRPEGFSYAIEDLAEVLGRAIDAAGFRQVDLIGHSFGGSTSIVLATRRPDLVRRLVVAEPTLDPATRTLSTHIARQSEVGFVARGYERMVHGIARQVARGDAGSAAFLATLRTASPLALHRSAISLLAPRAPSFRAQLEALADRATFIAGAASVIDPAPLENAGIRVLTLPDAGHTMMRDNPVAFAEAVASALR